MKKIILVFFFLLYSFVSFSIVKINLSVFFRFDKYNIETEYEHQIDSVIQKYRVFEISIKAHCDSMGSNAYNDALSMRRANAVKEYLVSKNLEKKIKDVQALGKRFPINGNTTAEERAMNRRADIVFITEDYPLNKPDSAPKHIVILQTDTAFIDTTSTLSLKDVEVGKTFVLENLNFVGGRHALLPKSQKTLKLLLNTLKAYPMLEIEIQGHICCQKTGDGMDLDTQTMDLSVNRAKAIYDYLIRRGIDPARLSYRGFGSSHKLVPEYTEADRSTNRRVEIKVLKK